MENQYVLVSQINRYLKSVISSDQKLKGIYVKGEISNFSRHYKTGHCYFSLKDETSVIKTVMFNSYANKIPFEIENGMEVVVLADVTVYEAGGVYQLNAYEMYQSGIGTGTIAFEKLKRKLFELGMFDEKHKKPLPKIPETVAVITSKKGAALQDILNILNRRFPSVTVLLCPVSVQGVNCASEVISALKFADNVVKPDIIVIARGGGSQEDLSAFNDEKLAYAVFECKTPVVSAIGHEIDFTICDFVADLRVPTPSAAAECIVPLHSELRTYLDGVFQRAGSVVSDKISAHKDALSNVYATKLSLNSKHLISQNQQNLGYISDRLKNSAERLIDKKIDGFKMVCADLEAVNPLAVLSKGYAIVTSENKRVSSVKNIKENDVINVTLKDGTINAKIIESGVEK